VGKSKVTVTISSDTSGFKTGLREAENGLAGFSTKLTSAGQSMMGFGAKMTLGITAPVLFAGKAVFDAASNMQESMGKVGVVFGEASDEVVAWSKNSAKSLGLSQQSALEAAGTYGNLFQAFGLNKGKSKEMSTSLVELAADLASFNNTSTDDALLALRSGLSGETEPLKKFGIALSDVRLKEEAMSLGLIKSTKDALNPAAKAQASYSLIMKDSTLAQGDFARTSDGAANKQRILKAQFDNAKTSIGQGLLPVATKLFGVFGNLIGAFNDLSPKMKNIILIGAGIAAAIGPIVTIFGALTAGVGLLLTPVGLVIGAIALVAAGFVYLYNTSEPVRKALDGLIGAFKNFDLGNIGDSLKDVGKNLSKVVVEGLGALGDAIGNIDWGKISVKVLDGLDQLKDAAFKFLGSIDWGGLALSVGKLIGKGFEALGKLFTDIDWKKVFGFILELGGDILALLGKIDWGKVAAGVGTALLGALKLVFVAMPKGIIKMVTGLFSAVGDLLSDVDWAEVAAKVGTGLLKIFELVFIDLPVKIFDLAWEGIKAAWEFIKDVDWAEVALTVGEAYLALMKLIWVTLPKKIFDVAWEGIKGAWNFLKDVDWADVAVTVGESFLGLIKLVFVTLPAKIGSVIAKGIKGAFKWAIENGGDLLESLTTWLGKIPDKIGGFFKDAGKWLVDAGKNIIQGLIDGAGKLLKKLGEYFLDFIPGWIKGAFKSALGISSPSKVFKGYGANVIEGFIEGLKDMKPIDVAMQKMANATSLNLQGATATAGTTIINNYNTVEAQMLNPSVEAGRVISNSLKEFNTYDGRG